METNTKQELDLEQKIKSLQGEINSKFAALRNMQNRLEKYYEELKLGNEYKKKNKIVFSDHSLLRVIERIYHVDIRNIKESLLSDEFVKRIKFIGKGRGTIAYGGIIYVVDNHRIITVYPGADM